MTVTSISPPQNSFSESEKSQIRREGFIDEALIQEMLMGNAHRRQSGNSEEIVISASEEDYAGWNLSPSTSFGRAA